MREWLGALGFLAFAVGVLAVGANLQVMTRFGPGPGFFLRGLAIVLIGLVLIHALTLVLGRRRVQAAEATPDHPEAVLFRDEDDEPLIAPPGAGWRFVALAGAMMAYALLIERLGFLVSTTLLCFVAMTVLGRPWLRSALEALVAILVAWLVFGRLLGVNLPSASLPPFSMLGL
ncbi:Tripartite tricarboxylate transporter TctB family protein [Devosia enhydra]|uniref:Tripartite tricarboxylate transporter TctB family protein n=1 Tax=Devosia enhydra TaxID=665118 RepID=A0A1K2I0Y1_9HYPH|nr:tripartite tricarboxylate transporter TctB family protein [Devosia enhydra]SFZ86042.1 Tripartite tricarboxylate transporter TctB family protein [Devosia enhydra]